MGFEGQIIMSDACKTAISDAINDIILTNKDDIINRAINNLTAKITSNKRLISKIADEVIHKLGDSFINNTILGIAHNMIASLFLTSFAWHTT